MPQRVRYRGFGNVCKLNGSVEGLLQGFVVEVMTSHDIAVRICQMMTLRTYSEPAPTRIRMRALSLQRIGHLNACPSSISWHHTSWLAAHCARKLGISNAGSITTQSLPPFPRCTSMARCVNSMCLPHRPNPWKSLSAVPSSSLASS